MCWVSFIFLPLVDKRVDVILNDLSDRLLHAELVLLIVSLGLGAAGEGPRGETGDGQPRQRPGQGQTARHDGVEFLFLSLSVYLSRVTFITYVAATCAYDVSVLFLSCVYLTGSLSSMWFGLVAVFACFLGQIGIERRQ